MFYASRGNLPGMAIFLDFRKAFDTIEWHYLEKVLTHFNFGPDFLQWFKILRADISSCVLNNGHASRLFIGYYRNVRGLGKSMVVFRFFEKLRYSNERSTIF